MHDSLNQLHIVFWIFGDTKLINPIDLFSKGLRQRASDLAREIKALEGIASAVLLTGERQAEATKTARSKSNCVRPPHPKGMGYASGRTHARLAGDQKSSSLLCPDSFDLQNCDSAFGFP